MAEVVTLELPETLAGRARAEADRTNRRLEEVLLDWLSRAEEAEPPVESLPDDQVLALSDAQMEPSQSEELADLLARNREGQLGRGCPPPAGCVNGRLSSRTGTQSPGPEGGR